MPKKHTYEFVKTSFENEGYSLISKEYINSDSKLEYRCTSNHTHSMRWHDWNRGSRCPECNINNFPYRYRVNKFESPLEDKGYTLLSDNVKNIKSKVLIRCNEGHTYERPAKSWILGVTCPICSGRATMEEKTPYIAQSLSREFYTFVSLKDRKIVYVCPNNHTHSIWWGDWRNGIRCPYCSGNIRKELPFIVSEFARESCVLTSTSYRNCYTKLEYICRNGHVTTTTWNDWQHGYRCRVCANIENSIRISGKGHPNWQGGISFEPYCEAWKDKEYKNDIKIRDGNKCLNPCCSKMDGRLVIHHIDYNKKNCRPSNLITVCSSCNSKANKDREWHMAWYQAIIHRRYREKLRE